MWKIFSKVISDIDESIISVQNLQSASFYEFRKILSSDQYSIGKKVADFLKDFTEKYKDADLAEVMPQPVILLNLLSLTFIDWKLICVRESNYRHLLCGF